MYIIYWQYHPELFHHQLLLSSLLFRCKKWGIPIEKIYNKTQREKFAWAIDMAEKDYEF